MKDKLTVDKDGVTLSRSYSVEEDGIETIKAVNRSAIAFNNQIKFDQQMRDRFRSVAVNEDKRKIKNIKLKTDNLYTIYN